MQRESAWFRFWFVLAIIGLLVAMLCCGPTAQYDPAQATDASVAATRSAQEPTVDAMTPMPTAWPTAVISED